MEARIVQQLIVETSDRAGAAQELKVATF